MSDAPTEILTTPRQDDLGLIRIINRVGLSISLLPNGAVFTIEHTHASRQIMINQVLASPIAGGMGRLFLRSGGTAPMILPVIGPEAQCRVGSADDRFVWEGETSGLHHKVSLWLHPVSNIWLWRVEALNLRDTALPCDAVLVQDLGLGEQAFVMNNEAYASQYIDHHIAQHPQMKYVLMSRQNLPQGGTHPWVAHGCLEGAVGFATDFRQLMGPAHRDADRFDLPFGARLPSHRLQHETACAALQSKARTLAPGASTVWRFFDVYLPDHPAASSDGDLDQIDAVESAAEDWVPRAVPLGLPPRSILHDASSAVADSLDKGALENYGPSTHVEWVDGQLTSFFTPGDVYSRHIVLGEKERMLMRRHGAMLFSGQELLPSEATLCTTCWMHGVFGAQLTIANTSFHKLLSVSRDPYNITRGSGLRMLIEARNGWRLLTVPSAFEIGLGDCRWIYKLGSQTVTISVIVASDEPAVQWRAIIEGEPCRFVIFGHLVLGEHEFAHAGRMEIYKPRKKFTFRPEPDSAWARKYPEATYHLVTSTPDQFEVIGADELLYVDGERRSGAFVAIRTFPTNGFAFAVVGSMTDPKQAEALSAKYSEPLDHGTMVVQSNHFWDKIKRGIRIESTSGDEEAARAMDTIFPWLVHDAMVHLKVPHGLEQYSTAAWGTRDVCQGPIELLLSLQHDEPAKDILRIVFAQQYEKRGDWPQWFMLEPYSAIQDRDAHGDVIVWPLKALCDYIEATGDFDFLKERVPWRRDENFEKTANAVSIANHVEKLMATVRQRFIAGTHLIRFGNGDWNDSLQPVDPTKRDWMVSSWTVALLYQQLSRYAEILRRSGREDKAREHDQLATAMREDFNRFLVRDHTVAGYGVFSPEGGLPQLLLHPDDDQTGISLSLLPITQAIGTMFTPEQTRHHLDLIRSHLLFSDGVRLMDRPMVYRGGPESIFRRAESASFFGREIGLMYVHAHLRYAEAMGVLGEDDALWEALLVANPIAVTDRLCHASARQRNTYFTSSDAAFHDRYQAATEWNRVEAKTIAVDGGWRIYSSGPGLFVKLLIQHALGIQRHFGNRIVKPRLPVTSSSVL
jgi:1,2-beta-oligoglucan phosphorylase